MLSREYLRENADAYRVALKNRGAKVDFDRFLELDSDRRKTIARVETLKNQRNVASQEIAALKKNKQDATAQIDAMKRVGDEIKQLDERLAAIEDDLRALELGLPNVPDPSVPVGSDESANRVERTWGEKPKFDFPPKPHWDLGEALGILDFDRAAKITGARFALTLGAGARLNRALIDFFLDHNTERGYKEVVPPYIVNADSLRGTGQLPKFEEDLFKLTDRDYYLIPTAEVPLTNIHRDEILDGATLPRFQELGLHYRVVTLATGDMGFGSAKTYDIEVWLPGQNTYREIASSTNFTDFQARRANIRHRTPDKKIGFVHTLNSSAMPVGRTLVAILENFQDDDGTVHIPRALQPYMKGLSRISL